MRARIKKAGLRGIGFLEINNNLAIMGQGTREYYSI